jgi:hypothetical protein
VTKYEVVIVPTVMSELSDVKANGRTHEKREIAQRVERRLNGLRKKGNLAVGVNVTRTVTVRTLAAEPSSEFGPSWLDRSVMDDRLVLAALEIQSAHPSAAVVLVIGDLNVQTKADALSLPYVGEPSKILRRRAARERASAKRKVTVAETSRKALVDEVVNRATAVRKDVPIHASGISPTVVTYHPSKQFRLFYGGDFQAYIAGARSGEHQGTNGFRGKAPAVVSSWPTDRLVRWLKEHPRDGPQDR